MAHSDVHDDQQPREAKGDATTGSGRQPVAVFDLDGCLLESGQKTTVDDETYWHNLWTNPDRWKPVPSLILLAKALHAAGWRLILLTSRPERYRLWTWRFLRRYHLADVFETVIMQETFDSLSSGEWKREQMRRLVELHDVQFVVEDYKPNADAIRTVVPVLLFESKR